MWMKHRFVSLFVITILAITLTVPKITATELQCYDCDNGSAWSKDCEKPHGDKFVTTFSFNTSLVTGKEDVCKNVTFFFLKHNLVTNEWLGRYQKSKASKSRQAPTIKHFCMHIITDYGKSKNALVHRDCIKGEVPEITHYFKELLAMELDLNDKSTSSHCQEDTIGSHKGAKRLRVCLCESNKCNNAPISGGSIVRMHTKHAIVISILLCLINYVKL